MRLAEITSGQRFRAGLVLALVFVLVLVGIGTFVLNVASASMQDALKAQVNEELLLFRDIREKEGVAALTDVVNALTKGSVPGQRLVGVFDANGKVLAGNLSSVPDLVGWGNFKSPDDRQENAPNYLGIVSDVGDGKIVVSRTTKYISDLKRELVWALAIAGLAVVILRLTVEYSVSRNSARKLDRIARTLDQVSHGDSKIRLPIGPTNDQIDRISVRINAHLERLSVLMDTTRNTIVGIAHDLRSPLNRAFLSLQEAQQEYSEETKGGRLIQQAMDELHRLGLIFDTMLRISRIEASNDRSRFTEVSVRRLLDEVVETYGPVLEDAGRTLMTISDAVADIKISGDRQMLLQLLGNLIENSLRYGSSEITVGLSSGMEASGVVLEVADHGPGIPAESLEDVLRPFHRLDAGGHNQGTGLGLALVQAIANRHGAKLELADNAPGLRARIIFPPFSAS